MVGPLEDVQVESHEAGVAVVSFEGEHDLTASESVRELLESLVRGNELVVVDFSEARFVDSSVLHVLVVTDRLARERGASFRVQLDSEAVVRRTFEISNVLERISWASSRQEALDGSTQVITRDSSEGSDGAPA
jgi:anti-anti-sigma factor